MSLPGSLVELSMGRVFVHRAGRGRPLVLVHGFMMSHWYWRLVIPALAERFEVLSVDLPGFGESDRPHPDRFGYDHRAFAGALAELAQRLGLAPAVFVGHSMGGGSILSLAAERPELVERLVLVAPAWHPLRVPPLEARVLASPLGWRAFDAVLTRGLVRRSMLRDHFKDPTPVTDEHVDFYWERLNRPGGRRAAYAAIRGLLALDGDPRLAGRVRAPTLIAAAEEDRVVPLESLRRLHRDIPGAALEVVPAAGHNVQLERPVELLRCVLPFVDAEPALVKESA
jgi:pimeloyl-ACP methyl ester carboxylesterase